MIENLDFLVCCALADMLFSLSLFHLNLSCRDLERRIHGRMSDPDHDDLLDFFDYRKPFKRVNLRQVSKFESVANLISSPGS